MKACTHARGYLDLHLDASVVIVFIRLVRVRLGKFGNP
jgi:hypothetical protein